MVEEINRSDGDASSSGSAAQCAPRASGWLRATTAGAIAGALVLLTGVVTVGVGYRQSSRAFNDEVRDNLIRLAQAAASQIDGEAHKTIIDRSQQESQEYRGAVKPLREMLRHIKGVKYIYTAIYRDGKIYFILDAAQAGDADGDGRDDQAKIMEHYTDPDPAMIQCFETGKDFAASTPYQDEWGSFVTGFAWFYDRQGKPVGVVGLDVTAEEYQQRLGTLRHASCLGLLPALVIALATGVGVSISYHNHFQARQFRLQAEEELRQQASILLAANSQLLEARARAQLANEAKSDFLANMSHEIRTPMTAIMGYAELLRHGSVDEADETMRAQAIATICRNGEHLLSIVNDILDLSKIEAGRVELDSVSFGPAELMREVSMLMQVRADEKNLELLHEWTGPRPVRVCSDMTRVRQILINLLGNAIKFTESGRVTVRGRFLKSDRARLEFDVVDTGIGMNDEQASRLFSPFTQADSSMTRRFGGTGLGLTISRRFAQMLGGDVQLVRSAPGEGSHFRVSVQVSSFEEEIVPLLPLPKKVTPSKPDSQSADEAPSAAPSQAPESGRPLSGASLLLAEDGLDNQRLIAFILRKAGATLTIADNGQLAVEFVLAGWKAGERFDLILMDMQMPVLDGYQATTRLRQLGYTGPIMALTAHAMAGDREKCLAAGCDEYATKPIDRAGLISQVHSLLSRETSRDASVPSSLQMNLSPQPSPGFDELQVHSLNLPLTDLTASPLAADAST